MTINPIAEYRANGEYRTGGVSVVATQGLLPVRCYDITRTAGELASIERITDVDLLEWLARHPGKLWIDASETPERYCCIDGIWHDDYRMALIDGYVEWFNTGRHL